jgi:hypothetical protein
MLTVLTNVAVYSVSVHNLEGNIYPPEADSIGIPIISSFIVSAFLLLLLIPASAWFRGRGWRSWVSLLLSTLAIYICVRCTIDWAKPHHFWIAVAYASLSAFLLVFLVQVARSLASNNRFERSRGEASVDEGEGR